MPANSRQSGRLPEADRVDRNSLTVSILGDDQEDRIYWHSRTPEERIHHMEVLRRINYGDAASAGLQRVLEVAEREQG